MTLAISSELVAHLAALAAASPDAEICGLLLGRDALLIEAIVPAANVAPRPETAFELDPATLFAALRAERGGGRRILGHYHSHPGGSPLPSPRDAAASDGSGALWLIVGSEGMRLWRAVPGGATLGAFEEVTLAIVPGAVAKGGASRHKGAVQTR